MTERVGYIGLGSNLGDRGATLLAALKMIDDVPGVSVRLISQFLQTEPVGGPKDQPKYINAVAEVGVSLEPHELLAAFQEIERALGRWREREARWGPRTCDLDILLLGELVVDEPELTIPHPRMHQRLFVLHPLASIAPGAAHPVLGKTAAELLKEAEASGAAEGPEAELGPPPAAEEQPAEPRRLARLISIIGLPASGKTTLAELLSEDLPAALLREDYEGNPFLADSYTGPPEARLPAQLFYLLSRVQQMSAARWPGEGVFVSDYGFCQDQLYASERLTTEELIAYQGIYQHLSPLVHPPDVLVLLDAPPQVLLERIARRGRAFEQVFSEDFLSSMRRKYNAVLASAPCPVLTVDCGRVDVRLDAERARLIEQIRHNL